MLEHISEDGLTEAGKRFLTYLLTKRYETARQKEKRIWGDMYTSFYTLTEPVGARTRGIEK